MSNSSNDIEEIARSGLELLIKRLIDLRTLNVVTAAADFDEINDANQDIKQSNNVNIQGNIDTQLDLILNQEPKNLKILAKTHIQIDGDCINIIPGKNLGEFSQTNILEMHRTFVSAAETTWNNRLTMIKDLIKALRENIFDNQSVTSSTVDLLKGKKSK